jgi:glutathione S-transferase
MLGTEYNLHQIDYFTGEHKSEEYREINFRATVPAAVYDGGTPITESNAVLMYAADRAGGETALDSKDLKQGALVNRWSLWEASVWFGSCYIYLVQNVVMPLLGKEPDNAALDAEEPNWNKLAKILDDQLRKS